MPRPTAATAQARARTDYAAVEHAIQRGNRVRAALRALEGDGRRILEPMLVELARALKLEADAREQLLEFAPQLLVPAARESGYAPATRALFDLQALATAPGERAALDLVDWIRTLGARPYRRERPFHSELQTLRRLRMALDHLDHLDQVEVPAARPLREALRPKLAQLESDFRSRSEPAIIETLSALPFDQVDVAALAALAHDLVDRMLSRGEASFADLRDAISRNDLSLRDLRASELVFGDTLHKADSRLADRLDGAYVRGEFYLRLLQSIQSLLFGTVVGRALSRFVLGPFGGAYIVLRFIDYIVGHLIEWTTGRHRMHLHLATPISLLVLGSLLCLVINVIPLRNAILARLPFIHHHGHDDEHPGLLARISASAKRAVKRVRDELAPYRYAIDERIRYRSETGQSTRWSDALFALAFFLTGYAFRFAFKLVVEPSINPIKHFPVVTVAGKISIASGLPILFSNELAEILPLALAGTLGSTVAVLVLPGICGFLAWELRVNWMLYQTQIQRRASAPPP